VDAANLRTGSEGDDSGPSPSRFGEAGDVHDRTRSNSAVMGFPSLIGQELSALDAMTFKYNQLAYEHAILKRQLAAKEVSTLSKLIPGLW